MNGNKKTMIVTNITMKIMMKYNSTKEMVTGALMTLNTRTMHTQKTAL